MTKSQLAAMIGARTQAKWPRSSYGTMYVKRGTPMNVSEFGPTFAAANATQRVQRRTYGYTGRGLYDGRGMYTGRGGVFSDIGGKLGDLFGKGYGEMGKACKTTTVGTTGRALDRYKQDQLLYTVKLISNSEHANYFQRLCTSNTKKWTTMLNS